MNALIKPSVLPLAPAPVPTPPLALNVLIMLRRALVVVLGLGLVTLLAGYGWTVQAQQSWAAGYSELDRLVEATRELEQATGALDAQVSTTTQMIPPNPDQLLVLKRVPPRPTPTARVEAPNPETAQARLPLAY